MSRSDNERLGDIIAAARRIAAIAELGRDSFDNDWKLQDAASHRIGIIVDAYTKLGPETQQAFGTLSAEAMTGARVRLVHIYWGINPSVIWDTMVEDIPPMARAAASVYQPPASGPTAFDEDLAVPGRSEQTGN